MHPAMAGTAKIHRQVVRAAIRPQVEVVFLNTTLPAR
jgi:hypothetical protein